jgi:hypothetical protein
MNVALLCENLTTTWSGPTASGAARRPRPSVQVETLGLIAASLVLPRKADDAGFVDLSIAEFSLLPYHSKKCRYMTRKITY